MTQVMNMIEMWAVEDVFRVYLASYKHEVTCKNSE